MSMCELHRPRSMDQAVGTCRLGLRPQCGGELRNTRGVCEGPVPWAELWECVQPSSGAASFSGSALRGVLGLCPHPTSSHKVH